MTYGYGFPQRGPEDNCEVNDVQRQAVAGVIAYLDRYTK